MDRSETEIDAGEIAVRKRGFHWKYSGVRAEATGGLDGATATVAARSNGTVETTGPPTFQGRYRRRYRRTCTLRDILVGGRQPRARPRKLATRSWPTPVSTDSGWNWTHSMGCSRWRIPITTSSPSWVVVAVTAKQSGTSQATSEW